MSQDVLEDINKKMEEMVEGRRYIIRQVGSLKVSVDELLEKLKTTTIGEGSGGEIDFSGLTPLIEGLNEEISKLREMKPESSKKEIDNLKSSIEDLKKTSKNIVEKIDGLNIPEQGADNSIFTEEINNLKEFLEGKMVNISEIINDTSNKVSELKEISPSESNVEEISKMTDKLDSLSDNLEKFLSKDKDSEIKEIMNKLVGIVLDLKADMENVEESFNFGLKVIENNLKNKLTSNSAESNITCEEDAMTQIKESLDKNEEPAEIYDNMLDLLYHIKKENKFDNRIPQIIDLIKELRSQASHKTIDNELKNKIKGFIE